MDEIKSLNTQVIMNMLNKEQMAELFLELKNELRKDSYNWFMLKIPHNLPHPYTNMCWVEGEPITLPNFLHDWSILYDNDLDDSEENIILDMAYDLVREFGKSDNIPIGIIEYLYSPELLESFRKNNIILLARQTTSPTREHSAVYKIDPPPLLTPVDLTFESKMFFYKNGF